MNEALLEAFRHNTWATTHLLEFCRDLPEEQLKATKEGVYGDVLGTFNHIIGADAGYLGRIVGERPQWVVDRSQTSDFDELAARAATAMQGWEKLLGELLDVDRVLILDDGAYEAKVGILVAQALHHGNAHREQICAILTDQGIQPPDVQAWSWGEATNRGGERTPEG